MLFAAAVLVACAVNAPGAPVPATATPDYHVRAIDPRVREWIKLGAAHSRTFDDLLNRLAKSDVIVYVQMVDRIPSGASGQIAFAAATKIVRYLRIEIDGRGSVFDIVSILGHELEHAVEIAAAPRVRDSDALATMYLRPGDASTWYDSAAARDTGNRIRVELARSAGRERGALHTKTH